jgi:hypothetical protein
MSDEADDAIDTLLRLGFEGPIEDDGFTDRVMRTLPSPHRQGAWFTLVGLLVGAVSCWMTVGSSPIILSGWHNWLGGRPSAPMIPLAVAVLGLSVLGLVWAISETMDENRPVLA